MNIQQNNTRQVYIISTDFKHLLSYELIIVNSLKKFHPRVLKVSNHTHTPAETPPFLTGTHNADKQFLNLLKDI